MKAKSIISVICVAVTSVGLMSCGQEAAVEKAYKKAFSETLVDPGSVQYRNVTVFKDGTACGEVNSKNRMGGYVGFRKFIFNENGGPDGQVLSLGADGSGAYATDITYWCNDRVPTREQKDLNQKAGNAEIDLKLSKEECAKWRDVSEKNEQFWKEREAEAQVESERKYREQRRKEVQEKIEKSCADVKLAEQRYQQLTVLINNYKPGNQ